MNALASSALRTLRGLGLVSCLTFLHLIANPLVASAIAPAPVQAAEARRPTAEAVTRRPMKVCTDFKNIRVVFINLENSSANCDTFRSFDDMISSMQQYSERPLHLGYLQIDPRLGNNYGSENFELSKLTISYDEFGIDWNRATKVIFVHEIGHMILDSYLTTEIPLLKTQSILKDRAVLYAKAMYQVHQLIQADPSCEQAGCRNEMQKIKATLPIELSGQPPAAVLLKFKQDHRWELGKLSAIQSGYDELYADLVQALVLNHPAINNQASRLFEIPTESCRTFSEDLPAGFVSKDAHCSLSGIRYQLWNEFVVPNLANKKMILTKLATTIQQEVAMQMRGRVLTPAEQGARLVQILGAKPGL